MSPTGADDGSHRLSGKGADDGSHGLKGKGDYDSSHRLNGKGDDDGSHQLLERAHELGHEARARLNDHASLKLWLRLLACTTQVEQEIRRRLRSRFGISLARFDYMAQLYRHSSGMKMKALSQCLMVTGGNITGLTDELERDALVLREQDPADRRSSRVRLTSKGRRVFDTMAREHERWILELLGSLDPGTVQQLYQSLGKLRVQMVGNSL